jgi:hypothetical protein
VNDFPRFDLEGRTALVTGAARGLGNAIALALAHAGADVALGLRDPASGADLAERIEGMGRRALRLPMDVRDLDQVRAAVDATRGPARPARHPGEQRGPRPCQPGRGRHRGRLRPDGGRQRQGHLLRQPGRGPGDDPAAAAAAAAAGFGRILTSSYG